jgi:nucleotide-binding universal stress UspA family protein
MKGLSGRLVALVQVFRAEVPPMGFRHILFPVDFSKRSYGAVPFVKALANRYHAAITLVHVVEPPPVWAAADGGYVAEFDLQRLKDEAEQRLASFAMEEFAGMSVTRMVEEGDPGKCISDLAHCWNADLIMMPTHGRGAFRRALLGSVTAKTLHDCECAIWTGVHLEDPPPPFHTELKTILCAIELTPESASLLKYAREIALEAGASVHIVHAIPTAEVRPEMYFDQPLVAFLTDFAKAEIAKLQATAGTSFDTFVEAGTVSAVVHRAASHFNADLIIIGRGIMNRFAGNLRTEAYGIMREAPCPVISV